MIYIYNVIYYDIDMIWFVCSAWLRPGAQAHQSPEVEASESKFGSEPEQDEDPRGALRRCRGIDSIDTIHWC